MLSLLVKSDNAVKGLKINNNIFLISQYADDTIFMLDGSPGSLSATMHILDDFALMSGLKINYSKTNMDR